MLRFIPHLLITLCLCSLARAQQTAEHSSQLAAGSAVERKLAGGEQHVYQLTLAAGEFARVEVEQRGLNLSIVLRTAAGERLFEIDDTAQGVELVPLHAEAAASFQLEVTAKEKTAPVGNYRLQLAEKRAAVRQDQERFTALRLNEEAQAAYYRQEKEAFLEAIGKWRQAATLWQALGDRRQEGRMLSRIGRTFYVLSEYRAALEAQTQAAQAFHDAGARAAEGRCLFAISTIHGSQVELGQALQYHVRGVQLWSEVKEPELPLLIKFQQGRAYRLTGDWQKARDLLKQLLAEARNAIDLSQSKYYERQALSELGYTAVGAGQPQQALDYFRQALPGLRADLAHPYDTPFVLNQMARAWLQLGKTNKAHEVVLRALQSARRLGVRRAEAVALTTLGQTQTALGRRSEAQAALAQAQALNLALGIKRDFPATALHLAQLARQQGEWREALKQVEQALAGIEELRANIPPGNEMRATFLATWNEAQTLQLDLLMQLHGQEPQAGYAVRAFDAAERTRARSLLELMLEVGGDLRQGLAPQLVASEKELRQQIAQSTVARERTQLLAEYDWIAAQIRQSHPRYAALMNMLPLQLAEVQTKLLDEQTLLLTYTLGPERSWLFAATPQGLQTFALPPRSEIEQPVRRYYQLMVDFGKPPLFHSFAEKQVWQQRLLKEQQAVAVTLSQLLLAPVQALLPGKRLLIVPDAMLSYLPFAALPEPGVRSQKSEVRSQRPNSRLPTPDSRLLLAAHEILTLPSASTLAVLRREWASRTPAPQTLALFADPVFGRYDDRVQAAGATAPAASLALRADSALSGSDEAPPRLLPRLPFSRQEAQAIAALVPQPQRKLALDFAAARAAVLGEDLSQYRYLHFATHGLLDNLHPELSALALSLVDRQGVAQDGFLRTMDVFSLKLNAELVVLSGCQTALGKEIRGEGLIGLTRGFLYAGAHRVVASLWQVNDAATAELMQQFYQSMLGEKKLPPTAALRAAQIAMWQDKRWQAPYYWAAFTLQGEW